MSVATLTFPEQLVLWAIRRWLEEHERHGLNGAARWRAFLGPTFIQACGGAAEEAADALHGLLVLMLVGGRRAQRLHRLHCPRLSFDERAILALIAAQQAGEIEVVQGRLHWFLRGALVGVAGRHLAQLAGPLAANGYVLPGPSPHEGYDEAERPSATLRG